MNQTASHLCYLQKFFFIKLTGNKTIHEMYIFFSQNWERLEESYLGFSQKIFQDRIVKGTNGNSGM